jgi:hypothetical protein
MKWLSVAAIIGLNVVDLGLTLFAVNVLGATEMNPVVAAIVDTPLIFVLKLVWVPVVAVVLAHWWDTFYLGLYVVVAVYVLVVGWNLYQLAGIFL